MYSSLLVIPEVYTNAADTTSTAPLSSISLSAAALKYGSTDTDVPFLDI